MTLRLLIVIPGLLFGHAVHAAPPEDKVAQRLTEPFAGYNRACGFPILFRPIMTVSLARRDARLGPIIVLDPRLTYPAQDAHRRFLIAHECAHHLFEHTMPDGLRQRAMREKAVEDQELSADCWAAEALVAAGHEEEVRFIVDLFYRKGLHSPGLGYPSGVQRSTLIYHCLRTAQRKQIVLRKSGAEDKSEE